MEIGTVKLFPTQERLLLTHLLEVLAMEHSGLSSDTRLLIQILLDRVNSDRG